MCSLKSVTFQSFCSPSSQPRICYISLWYFLFLFTEYFLKRHNITYIFKYIVNNKIPPFLSWILFYLHLQLILGAHWHPRVICAGLLIILLTSGHKEEVWHLIKKRFSWFLYGWYLSVCLKCPFKTVRKHEPKRRVVFQQQKHLALSGELKQCSNGICVGLGILPLLDWVSSFTWEREQREAKEGLSLEPILKIEPCSGT